MATSMTGMGPFGGKRGGSGDIIPKGYNVAQMQQFTPQQMKLHGQQFAQVSPNSYLGRLAAGDQSAFAETEEPAMRQFAQLQGNLASRFSGMGMGARKSSGFQNTTTAAAQDFASQLASKRMDMRRQAIDDLMGFSNQILNQKPYERSLAEKQQKEGNGWGGIIGGALGAGAGMLVGQPMLGASLGYGIGNSVSGGGGGGGGGGMGMPSWNQGAYNNSYIGKQFQPSSSWGGMATRAATLPY